MFKLTSLILLIHVIGSSQDHPGSPQMQLEHYKTKPDPPVDKVHVLTGLDVLLDKKMDLIQGKSVALVTNHTGIDKLGIPNYKHLANMKDIDLKVIFSPEHGLFGEAGAGENPAGQLHQRRRGGAGQCGTSRRGVVAGKTRALQLLQHCRRGAGQSRADRGGIESRNRPE